MSDNKGKNPWGANGSTDKGRTSPWGATGKGARKPSSGGGGNKGGGGEPPNMDDVLRRAQDNMRSMIPQNFQGKGIILLAILAVIVLWLAGGFYIVNPGEHAVIQRFGAWNRTQTNEGLGYHMPVPIETLEIVNVNTQRSMTIGFNELQNGSKQNVSAESLMLTSDRNIIDLDLVILWTIKSAEDYLFKIRDQENTIKKVAESAIREVVGQTEMFPIITRERAEVAAKAKDIIQKNLDEYNSGVNINQVLIQQAEVHPNVQAAFQDVQSAKQDAEDIRNRAEAYREDILPKARGQAAQMVQQAKAYEESVIARSTGDAERFNSVYQAYLTGQDVTKERLYLETMEKILGNSQKIIMDNSNGSQGVVPYLPLNELAGSSNTTPQSSRRSPSSPDRVNLQ